MSVMQPKDGRVDSPAFLGWVRRQPCRAGEMRDDCRKHWLGACRGPIDPHHVDGKGMGGARCRDDRTVPLCRGHHDRAHESYSYPQDELSFDRCDRWADETLRRFLDGADPAEVRQYLTDLELWRTRPLTIPF